MTDSSTAVSVPYWHVWTDEHGVSHQTRRLIIEFELKSISPPSAPLWLGAKAVGDASVLFTVLPAGWIGQWHENPEPQWIIPLSGRWFVETMDGVRVEMGAGELSFGEDQNTRERDGRRGHLSGVVGDEAAVLMLVQVERGARPPFRGKSAID
jgi:hypothetical protein